MDVIIFDYRISFYMSIINDFFTGVTMNFTTMIKAAAALITIERTTLVTDRTHIHISDGNDVAISIVDECRLSLSCIC